MPDTIDAEVTGQGQTMALQRSDGGAVGAALTIDELHRNLEFIREVMRKEMREGQDYGKIPGAGEKPTLLQPGAQKLLMTFNLTELVKKEVLREYPNMHREYEFTVTVRAANGKEWDGVGTCSTLETKYRYRKVERRCPKCGKQTIIAGKAEFGGGWLCWKKKGGCGAKFSANDAAITSQPGGKTENPDPADTWNTVRKMAFKRALVAAAINATNTSELWTQDIEDRSEEPEAPSGEPEPAPVPKPASKPKLACATERTRDWALAKLETHSHWQLFPEWLEAVGWIFPGENLQDWPLRYVPVSSPELGQLFDSLEAFANGNPAKAPYPAHEEPAEKAPRKAPGKPQDKPEAQADEKPSQADPDAPDAPWRSYVLPFGRQEGVALADLDKNYLYGLWANYQPKETWIGNDGREHDTLPADLARDRQLRAMLDQAGLHYEFKLKD